MAAAPAFFKNSANCLDLSIDVAFGHNELWRLKAANIASVTFQMQWPLATTNCGGGRPQIKISRDFLLAAWYENKRNVGFEVPMVIIIHCKFAKAAQRLNRVNLSNVETLWWRVAAAVAAAAAAEAVAAAEGISCIVSS